jgi:hypothetical protein
MFLFFLLLVGITVAIFYFLTLQNTLKVIQPKNRKMEPGQVWLGLIPIFGIVWHFFIIRRMADSISAEMKTRGFPVEPQPGYNIGLTFSILSCFTPFNQYMQPIGGLLSIATLVFLIMYWLKINSYKQQIEQLPPNSEQDSLIFK